MESKGVTLDFMSEVSKRLQRIKELNVLGDEKLLENMRTSVDQFRLEKTEQLRDEGRQLQDEDILCTNEHSQMEYSSNRKEIAKLKNTKLSLGTEQFNFMTDRSDEDHEVLAQIQQLQMQINQAKSKVIENESLVMNKEIENEELRKNIGEFQLYNQNKPRNVSCCKCNLF